MARCSSSDAMMIMTTAAAGTKFSTDTAGRRGAGHVPRGGDPIPAGTTTRSTCTSYAYCTTVRVLNLSMHTFITLGRVLNLVLIATWPCTWLWLSRVATGL